MKRIKHYQQNISQIVGFFIIFIFFRFLYIRFASIMLIKVTGFFFNIEFNLFCSIYSLQNNSYLISIIFRFLFCTQFLYNKLKCDS